MNQLTHTSPFDGIRHEDERGKEYWSARELGKLLGYSSWQSFQNTIVKAREDCVAQQTIRFRPFLSSDRCD